MAEIEKYDNLVIGSGEAGKYLAWSLAKAGQRTVVVEKKLIGGSCPNIACLPLVDAQGLLRGQGGEIAHGHQGAGVAQVQVQGPGGLPVWRRRQMASGWRRRPV